MRVTLVSLAKKLNLSPSTVGRALKNDSRISIEVRNTVRKLADEMGYHPNLLARSLVSDKSYSIGFIVNDISWSFFSEMSQFIQDAAENCGYSAFLYSSSNSSKKEEKGIKSIVSRRMDGLIIFANEARENISLLEKTSRQGFPVILLNNLGKVNLDVVAVDNLKGALQVMEHLFLLGHSRIAYIGPRPVKSVEKERLAGYEKAYRTKMKTIDKGLIFTGDVDQLYGYYIAKEVLQKEDRPTAIFAYNDTMALGIVRAIYELGLKIPADISVVGFDGLATCLSVYPPLTTVSVPIRQLANTAVEMLMHRIDTIYKSENNSEFVPQNIKLVPQLVIRESTGPAAINA
jgi:LacI family transcriptional regulator